MSKRFTTNSSTTRVRSWKSIQQEVRRPVTGERKTSLWKLAAICFSVTFFAVSLIFGAYLILFEPERIFSVGPDFRIERLHVETDGWLDEAWVRNVLELEDEEALLQADIFQMRDRILQEGQVRHCVVRKRLPDTLEVRLQEREPVVRLVRRSAGTPAELLLVARDGTIFQGHAIPQSHLRRLPFLSGVDIIEMPNGYQPIPGFQRVADLVDTARSRFPDIFRNWRIVDLSLYDPDPHASFSAIRVRSEDAREILFALEDYQSQILRLRDILRYGEDRESIPFQRIDLRFQDAVPVRP